MHEGRWQLLDTDPAWAGNRSHDALIAFAWSGPGGRRRLVAVNYADHPSQGFVRLPWDDLAGRDWYLRDRLGPARYERDGTDLAARGLYLDLPAWGCCAFEVQRIRGGLP
ncbi:hypothetical protein [Azotobacter vinelandii]|uniref:hypothetical protein n=1 Tax=Azotobacter vinelandii TaxID=354 RepID=UPI0026659236|nr:hypothetical protein [Azotobacter vinelandii]WKN22155.1 hypothetical protein AVAEIV_000103 [Azotobacter vinelandii]